MILAQNRIPRVAIYLTKSQLSDKSSTVLYAAKELRYYLGRMTSAPFALEEATENKPGIYLGDAAGLEVDDLGTDGFRILTQGNRLCNAGGSRGVIYGV